MAAKEPLEHVVRDASFPWRPSEAHLTECGLISGNVAAISLEEMRAKIKRQGPQRASFTSCMTCWQVATRHKPWDVDPVDAVRREAWAGRPGDGDRFRLELLAIAALIYNHKEEFEGYVDGLSQTVDLSERRRGRRR